MQASVTMTDAQWCRYLSGQGKYNNGQNPFAASAAEGETPPRNKITRARLNQWRDDYTHLGY
jgi:hypothetical protein